MTDFAATSLPHLRIHGLQGGLTACHVLADRPFVMVSPVNCAIVHGVGWFAGVIAQIRARHPDADFTGLIECADRAGAALEAVAAGIDAVRVCDLPKDARLRLENLAAKSGVSILETGPNPALLHDMEDHFVPVAKQEILLARFLKQLAGRT
jgi:hypothetical protein